MKYLPQLCALSALLLFSSCSNTTMADCSTDHSFDQLAAPVAGEEIAVIQTNHGDMKLRFFPCEAPETVKNFKELAKSEYFDGLIFHRVIKNFVNQGGDPQGLGIGGDSYKGPGTMIDDEQNDKISHEYGAVAMAKAGPNTATSQFYIVNNKNGTHELDGNYTVFAQVYEGLDVVEKIANVEVDQCSPLEQRLGCDKPLDDVVMTTVTIEKN